MRDIFRDRNYIYILGIVLLSFIISANIAWLNPNPSYVMKTNERIPLLWQYNGDAAVEFLSGAYFPQYFKIDKTRTNRPTYPLLVKVLGKVYGIIFSPFKKLGVLWESVLGYVTLKLIVFSLGAVMLYRFSLNWFSKESSLMATALAFWHPFAIIFIGTFHTSELEFITPIFILTLFFDLSRNYSNQKNVGYSFLTGVLMLAKQNYAVYGAVLAYSFFYLKEYRKSLLSFAIHLIPLVLWLIVLKILHIPYYNHEAHEYGQGVWLYKDLIHRPVVEIIKTLAGNLNSWLLNITGFFSIGAFLSIFALQLPDVKKVLGKHEQIFIAIFLFFSWLQSLAANRYASYMSADLAIIIWPLAAVVISVILERYNIRKWTKALLLVYLIIGLTTLVKFPWVSPYKQINILNHDITTKD